ncbi:MAG: hypothetical protein ABSG10_04705 [Terracidiphilus sp.]
MLVGHWQDPNGYYRRMPTLKKLFWAYFLLLIFEGALRKWIVPQLSAPLLLVRDPVAMLIILEAYRTNKWPEKWSIVTSILSAGLIGLCFLQAVVGNNPWVAAVYGLRSYLLPFPVAFIMGENLDAEDLRKFGACTLWLMLPETVLEIAQYITPAHSFLNAGAYAGAEQIGYAGGHVRASGTFSFVSGPAIYGPLVAVFLLYGVVNDKLAKKWLLWAATAALILSVPMVGSRSYVVQLATVVVAAGVAGMFGVSQFLKMVKIAVPLMAMFFVVSLLPVFSRATSTMAERFQGADEVEGGGSIKAVLAHRVATPLLTRIEETDYSSNPIGIGMGRGAPAITTLLEGTASFAAGEDELDHMIIEFGPYPGLAFALFRLILGLYILGGAVARAREGEPLAILLSPLMITGIILNVLEQPTGQGFMVILLAFSLAAVKPRGAALRPTQAIRNLSRPMRYSAAR